jgi:AcrR family transcriptional regulator
MDDITAGQVTVPAGASPELRHAMWRAPKASQQERYERIVQATIRLARDGGHDAVQMRDVAVESGASLGTVYTYFQTRDNLLYRTTVAWTASCVLAVSPGRDAPIDLRSIEADITKVVLAFLAEPGLLNAYIRSTLSTEPVIVEQRKKVDWTWWVEHFPTVALLVPDDAELAPRLLSDVFYSATLRWAFGQIDGAALLQQMLHTVRLLVRATSVAQDQPRSA